MAQIFVKTRHTSKIPAGVSGAIRRGQFCEYNAVFAKIWRHFTELLLQIPGSYDELRRMRKIAKSFAFGEAKGDFA